MIIEKNIEDKMNRKEDKQGSYAETQWRTL